MLPINSGNVNNMNFNIIKTILSYKYLLLYITLRSILFKLDL